MPLTKRRIRTAGSVGVGPRTPNTTIIPTTNAANLGTVTEMLQQFTETTGSTLPIPVSTTTNQSVQEQLDTLKQIVTSWDGVLREITQSVFGCLATTTVGGLPYYTELPTSEADLGVPRARLAEDQRVTLVYPQLQAAGYLFMRLRVTDPGTGEIEQFYVPVTNMSHPSAKAAKLLAIAGDAQPAYFDHFHNPGERDPKEQ